MDFPLKTQPITILTDFTVLKYLEVYAFRNIIKRLSQTGAAYYQTSQQLRPCFVYLFIFCVVETLAW